MTKLIFCFYKMNLSTLVDEKIEPVVAHMEFLTIQMNAVRFVEVLNTCRIELQRTKSFDSLTDLVILL